MNVFELIAAKFVILKFAKQQPNITLHLQIYRNTALSYLLKMGVTHNRELFSKSIWNDLVSKQALCLQSTLLVF